MAGFDLASIISQATQLTGEQTQQSQEIAGLSRASQDMSNQQAAMISEAGNLQSQVQLVQLQGQLETQKAGVAAANAFGTNVGDVSDIITQLGQSMRETGVQLTAAQDKVTKIEANSDLLGNPLGWLTDLLTGDGARAERDALAQKFDTTQKIAQGLNAQTQSTVQTQNAITETLSTTSIKQAADATQKLADAKALEAKIQGNRFGVDAVEALRQNGAQQFNRQMQVYNQVTEDARWQEGMALRKEQFLATQEARKRGKVEDQYYVEAAEQVNTYNRAAGLPEMNQTQVRAQINQAGKIGDAIRDRQAQGFQMMESGSSANMYGITPSQTMNTLERDRPKLPAAFQPAKEVLNGALTLASTEISEKLKDPINGEALKKDKLAQSKIFDAATITYARNAQSNIQTGKGNPYEAVPISTVLAETAGLKDTKFGQTVLQTLVSTGQPSPAPDLLLATAAAAVDKGELSFNEARDGIASFYDNAVGIKNATGGFLQLGVPKQVGYNTRISAFSPGFLDKLGNAAETFTGLTINGLIQRQITKVSNPNSSKIDPAQKAIDLTKPTDVTLALTLMKSKKLSQDILNRTPE